MMVTWGAIVTNAVLVNLNEVEMKDEGNKFGRS